MGASQQMLMSAVAGTTLRDEILADTPTALWLLNESSGTTASDSSGNSVNGTYTLSNVTLGQAALANGSPSILAGSATGLSVILVGDNAAFTFDGGDFTLGCAFKNNSSSNARSLMVKEKIGADFPEVSLQITSAGLLRFQISSTNGAGGLVTLNSASRVDDGVKHLAVIVRSGTSVKGYLDDVEVLSGTFSGSVWNSTNALGIGCSQIASGAFSTQPSDGNLSHAFTIKSAISTARRAAYFAAFNR